MERNAKEASLWTRGFNWSNSLQKLRRKPETVGLNVNVEALASLFKSPTANKREQWDMKWNHEGNTGEKNCKWLLRVSHAVRHARKINKFFRSSNNLHHRLW